MAMVDVNGASEVLQTMVMTAVVWGAPSAVVDDAADNVRGWLEREVASADAPLIFAGLRVEYRIEHHNVPPPEALRNIREAVKGHPDHPDARRLKGWDAALAGKPLFQRYVAWSLRTGGWRWNAEGDAVFMDHAQGRDGAWQLSSGGSVKIIDPRPTTAPHAPMMMADVSRFFGGGLRRVEGMRARVEDVTMTGPDAFRAKITAGHSTPVATVYEVAGRWLSVESRGEYSTVRVVRADHAPAMVGTTERFLAWGPAGPGRSAAFRVERVRPDGALEKVYVLEGVVEEPEGEKVLEAPTFDRADAVRNVMASRIYTESTGISQERGGKTVELGAADGREPLPEASAWTSRVFVWILIPAVVAGVIGWRWWTFRVRSAAYYK